MQNILIIGGNGFIGSSLARAFSARFSVTCTHQNTITAIPGVTYVQLSSLNRKDECAALVQKVNPQIVIYCAGIHDLLYCEQNTKLAQDGHSAGISHILNAADILRAKFIYLSSDFIFSGVDGNYSENDTAIPSFALGKYKLGAENFVRSRSVNHVIIRCAPLLGRGPMDHPSWLDKLRETLLTGKKIKLTQKMLHNPVHIQALITMIDKIIESEVKNKTLHLGGLSKVSLFEVATIFAVQYGLPIEGIEPSDGEAVTLPSDYSLNFTQSLRLLQLEPWFLEQSLDLLK